MSGVLLAARAAPTPTSGVVRACSLSESSGDAERAATTSQTCASCHHFEKSMSHPVNIPAGAGTPANLPLENGMISCLTCHEATPHHDRSSAKVALRASSSAALCVACHTPSATDAKNAHALAIGRAHLGPTMPFAASRGNGTLDSESQACMSCHDGSLARESGPTGSRARHADHADDHPLGVAMTAGKRVNGSDFTLANPRSLDRRVRLFDGAVGCGSCHSAYSREQSQLVMSNRGSRLCLTCHTQ
ncbi:MAG: cytochrome c3 family protein [Planctomycetota bacterium]|nr:cytochrome c3 family protein [Planctomycetota bacterium]